MKKRYIIALICLIIFVLITVILETGNISSFDECIYKLVYSINNKYIDRFFINFTHIGDTLPVIIISVIIFIFLKDNKDRVRLMAPLAITVAINQLLKHVIARPRPPLDRRLITQGGYSFPSGHSMASMCLYGFLIYLVNTKISNKKVRILLTILLTLIILLIGISRIYVGVHYPSDVLAGFLLTITILICTIEIINYHFKGE